jgi:hypothetical protein
MSDPASQAFVPLAALSTPGGRKDDFHVLVAQRPEIARSLRELTSDAPPNAAGQAHRSTCEPRVTLQREADVIVGIRVECSCGQVIDLKCDYQDNPSAPA